MNLATLDMPKDAARKAFLEYRRSASADAEDKEIMRGYREIAKGRQLISLSATLRAGGQDELARPRLAIAQADAPWVWLDVRGRDRFTMHTVDDARWDGRMSWRSHRGCGFRSGRCLIVRFPPTSGTVPADARAMVPKVPAPLRPAKLHLYHVLWEAEWQPVPPRDPVLLKHIGGDLYAVIAQWDLTELERAVLARRFM